MTISEPEVQAFRKATWPAVEAFKARGKSPLVDQAAMDAAYNEA